MASIRKRGEKYDVRWRDPDGSEHTRTCPNRSTALALKRDVEETRARGQGWKPGASARAPALTEALDEYLVWRASRKAASTIKGDDSAITHLIEWAARRRWKTVDHLTIDTLNEWDLELRRDHKPRTANGYVLKARRWMAWLSAQPKTRAFVAPPPEPSALDLPDIPWAPPNAPQWADMDGAIANADLEWVADAMVVMRYTGLRQCQAFGVRWDDFHADGRDGDLLHIRPELGKSKQERAGRIMPVTPLLLEHFAGRGRRDGYLVAPDRVSRRVDSWRADGAWERAKVPERLWRGHPCHAFRYGFESGLVALGADYRAVEFLVGHAVEGAGSSYLDTRWALRLREVVDLVPRIGSMVRLDAARGMGGARPPDEG